MIIEQSKQIIAEVNKAFIGKNDIVEKVLMTIYAGGHVLLEDCPGVGKTTLALAFSKALGLRAQAYPVHAPTPCPRTSPASPCSTARPTASSTATARPTASFCWRTRSTVPRRKRSLRCSRSWRSTPSRWTARPHPAALRRSCASPRRTPFGSAGTQQLPESQLDRFMVCLSIGYPTLENQMKILNTQRYHNPLEDLHVITSAQNVLEVQQLSVLGARGGHRTQLRHPSVRSNPRPIRWSSLAFRRAAFPRWSRWHAPAQSCANAIMSCRRTYRACSAMYAPIVWCCVRRPVWTA